MLQFEPFYQTLIDTLAAYSLAASTIYTDQNTVAPKKGADRANAALSILSQRAFEIENDPETFEAIEAYAKRLPDGSLEKQEVELRLRNLRETRAVDPKLFGEYVQIRANSETTWHEAKEKSDYALFRPILEEVMKKTLELTSLSPRSNGTNTYDLLLDQYEPGMDQAQYDAFFAVIKEELLPLIAKVASASPIDTTFLNQPRDLARQEKFADVLLDFFQANPERLAIGTTEHPFTNFHGHDDVRITTHYYPDQFLSAVLSTVHEYGHGLYHLQTNADFDETMLVNAVGTAAHESQSRLLENHIGRSDAFWKTMHPELVKLFPEFAEVSPAELARMINASFPSLIRTEADELTYPIHILIRYEIEKMMADGSLDYDKLPQIWADKYEQYLGVRPSSDKEGLLQDMHWSAGYLGYFPSYALGSAYAVQIFEAMARDFDVDKAIEDHDFGRIAKWLEDNVHHYGASKSMKDIVEEVSGKPFDPHIYTQYLKDKYTKLYQLDQQ